MANRRRTSPDAPGGSMGDVLDELDQEGHLSPRQRAAAAFFLRHLKASHGTSHGLVGQVDERVDTSRVAPLRPAGGDGAPVGVVDQMLRGLRSHERELIAFLVRHRELPRGSLADFGRTRSGYATRRLQRAVTVGRITAFLDTIAEIVLPVSDAP